MIFETASKHIGLGRLSPQNASHLRELLTKGRTPKGAPYPSATATWAIAVKRFHIFERIRQQLEGYDNISFFNANCRFHASIDETNLPNEDEGLIVVRYSGHFGKAPEKLPYDCNPPSPA